MQLTFFWICPEIFWNTVPVCDCFLPESLICDNIESMLWYSVKLKETTHKSPIKYKIAFIRLHFNKARGIKVFEVIKARRLSPLSCWNNDRPTHCLRMLGVIYVGMHYLMDKGVGPTSNQNLTNNVEPMSRMVNVICQRWANKTENLTSTLAQWMNWLLSAWVKWVKQNRNTSETNKVNYTDSPFNHSKLT